ncbi:cupin domain-containing protein [Cytobacillus dafuensis]|uniref:cupin domain-containing protein n=1 Tax=Cytobacillus dafuensis TaxID=1742359 RepID=UPI00070D7FEB|nr:cupin domain-containing protein [Cytobacillus dafuensis]
MNIIHEQDVKGDQYTGEFSREIKHLSAPWTLGSQNVWVGVINYEPHCTSNMHSHDIQEEVFYCISGSGEVIVGEEKNELKPGTCVYVPPKSLHQIINNTDQVLKVLSAVSPAFEPSQYAKDHKLNEGDKND